MKLIGIQMNASGKDRFVSRCLVGVVGIVHLCFQLYNTVKDATKFEYLDLNLDLNKGI